VGGVQGGVERLSFLDYLPAAAETLIATREVSDRN
jgi:hypothetical protein